MESLMQEELFYGSRVKVLERKDNMSLYQITDETGKAEMTSYQVFDGITIVYNDVHMEGIHVDVLPQEDMYEINHCNEGRIECEFNSGDYLYMAKGDFSMNRKDGTCHQSYFPVSHYHGVSILVIPKIAQREIDKQFGKDKIDLNKIFTTFCKDTGFYVTRENESMEHIFHELYHVPEKIKQEYFRLKVLEVILFLSAFEQEEKEERVYYSKIHVQKVKNIQKQLVENLDKKYTLQQLAIEHDIALTSMKKCFKGVFDSGIYAYIKEYRMQEAAKMLLETEESILNIANCVGYENGSKFSAAFKDVIGITPKEFRKSRETMPEWSEIRRNGVEKYA